MKSVRIYILWIDDVFYDVFASYSEASRIAGAVGRGHKTRIDHRDRWDY